MLLMVILVPFLLIACDTQTTTPLEVPIAMQCDGASETGECDDEYDTPKFSNIDAPKRIDLYNSWGGRARLSIYFTGPNWNEVTVSLGLTEQVQLSAVNHGGEFVRIEVTDYIEELCGLASTKRNTRWLIYTARTSGGSITGSSYFYHCENSLDPDPWG